MILLAVVFAALTLIVLAMVVGPLFKPTRAPPARAAFDRAVYRDQLKELEREAARDVVLPSEAAAARLELQRRLLAVEGDAGAAPGARQPLLALGLALLVVIAAGGIYWRVGSPRLPDEPYAARGPERAQAAQMQAQMAQIRGMVAKLAAEMKQHPGDLDGWLRLGRSYAVLGQSDDAAAAFAQAERLKPNDLTVLMTEVQALMIGHSAADPIPPQVVALLQRVRALDPSQPAVLWYLGMHAAQEGDFASARSDWQKLLAAMPPSGEARDTVLRALGAIKNK